MADELSIHERTALLTLVRAALERPTEDLRQDDGDPLWDREVGLFVSLYRGSVLRGCVGYLSPFGPLRRMAVDCARKAAFHDHRFQPIGAAEVAELTLEVSLLSPLRRVSPGEVTVGRDGVVFSLEGVQSVFLPQVAVEQGWNQEQLFQQLARKAGLDEEAWRDPSAILHAFTAEVFSDSK